MQPRSEQRVLGAHESIKMTVRFAPKRRGVHEAAISIIAGSQPVSVALLGDANGPPDSTSFYACSCSGSGSPAGSLPLVFAVLLVIRRRKR